MFKYFPEYSVVELNQSTGLRTGHMIAQTPMSGTDGQVLENGAILSLSKAGALGLAAATDQEIFLHYTEEHMPGYTGASAKYFAVPFENGVCYPRAIALYSNDRFTTNNYELASNVELDDAKFATVVDGKLTLAATAPASGTAPLFKVSKTTMPDGSVGVHFVYLGVK